MSMATSGVFEEHAKIPNHQRALTRTIYDFARSGDFCDIQLHTKTRSFYAHKLVLAASSPFFAQLFSNGATEGVIELRDIDDATVELVLKFIYAGEATITDQNIWNLLEASYMYQIQSVIDVCVELILMKNLDCIKTLIVGDEYSDPQLKEYGISATVNNFKDIGYSRLNVLPPRLIEELVALPQTHSHGEDKVIECILSWVECREERLDHLPALIQHVNFPSLDRDYVLSYLIEQPIIKDNLPVREFILRKTLKNMQIAHPSAVKRKPVNPHVIGLLTTDTSEVYIQDLVTARHLTIVPPRRIDLLQVAAFPSKDLLLLRGVDWLVYDTANKRWRTYFGSITPTQLTKILSRDLSGMYHVQDQNEFVDGVVGGVTVAMLKKRLVNKNQNIQKVQLVSLDNPGTPVPEYELPDTAEAVFSAHGRVFYLSTSQSVQSIYALYEKGWKKIFVSTTVLTLCEGERNELLIVKKSKDAKTLTIKIMTFNLVNGTLSDEKEVQLDETIRQKLSFGRVEVLYWYKTVFFLISDLALVYFFSLKDEVHVRRIDLPRSIVAPSLGLLKSE